MNKTIRLALSLCIVLAILSVVALPEAQARGWIINLRRKYTAKIITRIVVGPWSPWSVIGTKHICVNTLAALFFGRSRVITKTFWVADRWLAAEVWAWPREWRFFEQWKNVRGPFQYSITQTETMDPVVTYTFDPLHYDDRYNDASLQQYYENAEIVFNWAGIDGIMSQLYPGVPVSNHTAYFDDVPIPDYFKINLLDYSIGSHQLRIAVTYKNEILRPDFLIIPIQEMSYINLSVVNPIPEIEVMQGGYAKVNMSFFNNLPPETGNERVPYFTVEGGGGGAGGGAYDTTIWDVDVWDNASYTRPPVPPQTESFFDVFIRAQHDAPIGTNATFVITAHTLDGFESSVTVRAVVVAPTFGITLTPSMLIIPKVGGGYPTVLVKGSGWTPGGNVSIYFSHANETPIGHGTVLDDGTFSTTVTIKDNQGGIYSLAAVDDQGCLAAAQLTIVSCDIDGDGQITILDIVLLCTRYAMHVPPMMFIGVGTITVVPFTAYWLRKKQRKKEQPTS
jgi:hypothetical protein